MQPRTLMFCVAATLGAVAMATSLSSRAQGALKPVEAVIINPADRPVPVSVVTTAAAPMVYCQISFGFEKLPAPTIISASNIPLVALVCPPGLTRIDVARVAFDLSSENTAQYGLFLTVGGAPLAALSDGTPDLTLPRAFRIDTAAGGSVRYRLRCTTGIASVFNAECGGTLYLIGTPAN
jgi:hypothetical protein